MEAVNLSQANQVALQKQQTAKVQVQPKPEEKKNGKKMLAIGAAAAATIAIAGIAIYKGKGLGKSAKLQDIKFDKGIAKKGDELFTGVVKDTLKSGNKATLEYVDGVIQKSTVKGSRNFEKVFNQQDEAGQKIVKTIENGTEKITNIAQKQADAIKDQEKLNKLLKDTNLSSKELRKQADEIKFKSKNQQKELENVINSKVQIEAKAAERVAQEKAAKEAAAAAQEQAKAEAEKAAQEQAKAEAEKAVQEQAKAEAEKVAQENIARFENNVKNNIKNSKIINSKVDEIMQQSNYNEKIEKLLNTEITAQKGKYDATMEKTTINKIMDETIKGEYKGKISTIYHGTTENLKNEIVKNGFSIDACGRTESGKGIYFALDKLGCESKYGQGGLITAEYTGKKVAEVEPGVIGDLHCSTSVRQLFNDIFGHEWSNESDDINCEIINRIYTKKLSDLGYGALHIPYSRGAKCEYVTILDPKNIKIIK